MPIFLGGRKVVQVSRLKFLSVLVYLKKKKINLIVKSFCYTADSSIKIPLCLAINQHSWSHLHFAHILQLTQQGLPTFLKQK